jgi:hypothetical protein
VELSPVDYWEWRYSHDGPRYVEIDTDLPPYPPRWRWPKHRRVRTQRRA